VAEEAWDLNDSVFEGTEASIKMQIEGCYYWIEIQIQLDFGSEFERSTSFIVVNL
jgi:hypothetical protein